MSSSARIDSSIGVRLSYMCRNSTSTRSVCRRFRLASTARVTCRRDVPRALMSSPIGLKHLVVRTRLSRSPLMRRPRISSDLPLLYWSAQSKKLMPASRQALNMAPEVASSASPPKDMVPKHSSETSTPVRPSGLVFICGF
jgi:hypothetical protein